MIDTFFWASGIIAWLALGTLGLMFLADWIMDIFVTWFWTKREFLAFVADRLKTRRGRHAN